MFLSPLNPFIMFVDKQTNDNQQKEKGTVGCLGGEVGTGYKGERNCSFLLLFIVVSFLLQTINKLTNEQTNKQTSK